MVQAKLLRDVAVPTNWRITLQAVPELIQDNSIPAHQLSIRA
jgi:hypothetical protein